MIAPITAPSDWFRDAPLSWFDVPGTSQLLQVSDNGDIKHSLSGFQFTVGFESDEARQNYYVCEAEDLQKLFWQHEYPRPGETIPLAQALFTQLVAAACPLHSRDIALVQQWESTHVATLTDHGMLIEHPLVREDRWRLRRKAREPELRRERQQQKAADEAARRQRAAQRQSIEDHFDAMTATQEFDDLFLAVYGRRQRELGPSDPPSMVYWARRLVTFRLGLEWPKRPKAAKGRSTDPA